MRKLLAGAMGAVVVLVWGGLGLMPGRAEAQVTRRVENYGVDSSACGTLAAPCRSITRAIANASPGDIVSVGPGHYGDLNGDGILFGPGEETAPCLEGTCLLLVNKRLTIRSTQGAGATVIDAGGASLSVGVFINADGVVFGRQDTGFTITGIRDSFAAIVVGAPGAVSVGGNRVVGNTSSYGIILVGTSGSTVARNLVTGEQTKSGEGVIPQTSFGIAVDQSTDASVTSNVVTGVGTAGFTFNSGVVATGNAAIGNRGFGFQLVAGEAPPGTSITLRRNTAAGNLSSGIEILGSPSTNPVTLRQNNIYGNGNTNCGLLNITEEAIDASNNFWGAASGPGPDPADEICNFGASSTTFVPFATVPFPIPGGLAGK